MSENSGETPIIGIGASAGGLEALKAFVQAIPADLSACYVIVQHLAPDQASIMDQLLQPIAPVPVTQIEDGETAKPAHVYIVPPGVTLKLSDGHFTLTERSKDRSLFRPIDMFFNSLAEVKGRDAFCVVLSGTGTDGSEGLKKVKAAGGFALVQESTGARFPGMPDSAVATGMVDFVLPARKIAERLQDIITHRQSQDDDTLQQRLRDDLEASLPEIASRLADVSGIDFSEYKPGTLLRRIERRMSLLRISSAERFIALLDQDETQATLLAQEFLIGVTRFFRDPEAWDVLRETVVRPILKRDQRNIRIWVPGCSTGEEAFSIAIMFLEEIEALGTRQNLQVFGTDIDSPALMNARQGAFSPVAVEALTESQRERFFTIENGQFRAVPELRECCVFAPHNLVQDPPFSRLDLISCRNLLIYLSPELQQRVFPRLHFALREGGHLMLGPSETIGGEEDLFVPVDRTHKIFRKNMDAITRYSALSDPLPRTRDLGTRRLGANPSIPTGAQAESARESMVQREFLQRFAPPFALITQSGEIGYLSAGMTDFVQPNAGVPSNDIDAYLRRELRLPLRNAIKQCRETGEIIDVEDVMIEDKGTVGFVDIRIGPLLQDSKQFLVTLNRVRTVEPDRMEVSVERRQNADQDMLEAENFSLRQQLAAALQEFETSGQELKSTNEELLSMNEELQSSNEELETSREELQSINEELETVNSELQENNRLLTRANSDLKNLFESTDVAVLFLDRNFCVRNFTPATNRLFGIRKRDIGRPISDLSSKMDYPGLAEDASEVDYSLQPLEREVHISASGETYLLRIKPYRTTDNVIDGYVLSFVDITNRKNAEETLQRNQRKLAEQYAELENLYDTTPVGLALMDRDFRWIRINDSLAAINGYRVEDHIGVTQRELLPEIADEIEGLLQDVIDTGVPKLGTRVTGETAAQPGEKRHWIVDYYPVATNGEVFAIGACVRDVTEQTRLVEQLSQQSEQQKLLMGELEHRVKNTLATITGISRLLLKENDTAADYQKRLVQRLQAISRTHDLLTGSEWTGVSLNDLLAAELAPFTSDGAPELERHGPNMALESFEVLPLGMALHELATNAGKYGALSVSGGKVIFESDIVEKPEGALDVTLTWREEGGPRIEAPPSREGFGSTVFDKVLARDLEGTVERNFTPNGLNFTFRFRRESAE